MTAELAVALLGGHGLERALSERIGVPVTATEPGDHLDVAHRLGLDGALVVGMSAVPWPNEVELHTRASASLPSYTGVVAWHALPALAEALSSAIAPGARAGAHVMLTAPDPGADTEPADVVFLREVAEAVAERVSLASRSIAWRGTTRTPTARDALRSVVEVHGHRDVVECPVAPGTGGDPSLLSLAEELGCRLTTVDLGRASLLDLLAEVVATVAGHELDDLGDANR